MTSSLGGMQRYGLCSLLIVIFGVVGSFSKPFPGCVGGTLEGCPGTANCTVDFIEQNIDHFNWAPPLGGKVTTYKQRYFTNKQWWRPGGPIFFYLGNEDNVELYVNHTGLMWEHAAEFNALMVFAEHRYYGKSLPFSSGTKGCMSWLTTEQALADFAYLIDDLQRTYSQYHPLPVIGFGGSYGGMMASWFRLKYPESVDGVIAASAPIWSFAGLDPPYNYNAFNIGVTFDATAAGGASDYCKSNLKSAWYKILGAGQTAEGRKVLSKAFRTCKPVQPRGQGSDDPYDIMEWAQGPWANMAMGNYPYASSYLMHGKSLLPPWPVRAACSHLDKEFTDDESLFEAVREAAATQLNNTGDKKCFDIFTEVTLQQLPPKTMKDVPRVGSAYRRGRKQMLADVNSSTTCEGSWGYQWCTEMVQPFTQGTPDDMFYCANGTYYQAENCSHWDFEGRAKGCQAQWGVTPRKDWARLGLASKNIHMATNIVFSNGRLDPWHGGGVLHNISDTVVAVIIENGAHHIDLMFTDPEDAKYPDIGAARELELAHIRKWVDQKRKSVTSLIV